MFDMYHSTRKKNRLLREDLLARKSEFKKEWAKY